MENDWYPQYPHWQVTLPPHQESPQKSQSFIFAFQQTFSGEGGLLKFLELMNIFFSPTPKTFPKFFISEERETPKIFPIDDLLFFRSHVQKSSENIIFALIFHF